MRFAPALLFAFGLFAASLAIGCESPDAPPGGKAGCGVGPSRTYVITKLGFTREGPKGVTPGFNLDGKTSDPTVSDDGTCGKKDLTDPTGATGIDNQVALLIPDIEKQVGNAIDGLIQGAIDDGRLLIMLEQKGVADPYNADCVDLEVQIGAGKPSLGTDGVMEAWQTFDLRKDLQQKSFGKAGRMKDGTFTIGPFDLRIPIAIFDVSFILYMRDARVKFTLDDDGNAKGLLGGNVSIDEIAEGVKNGAGIADKVAQLRFIGKAASDMGYDPEEGTCSLLSAAMQFEARPAFLRKPSVK